MNFNLLTAGEFIKKFAFVLNKLKFYNFRVVGVFCIFDYKLSFFERSGILLVFKNSNYFAFFLHVFFHLIKYCNYLRVFYQLS